MIEVTNLTKRYGSKLAVNSISFHVEKGEIVGFLGPNGAGKSTTMNVITGYISASGGNAKIAGFDVLDDPIDARRHIGYLPEQPPLYIDMTVDEYLSFVYNLKKVAHRKKEKHISDICELVGLSDHRVRTIRNLSKGYKQRVGLAQALIGDPDVLILDEPTVGLDPNQIIEIRNVIKDLGKQRTIILSTHILPEVSAVCERVLVISGGVIVADDTPENLESRMTSHNGLMTRIEGDESEIIKVIKSLSYVSSVEVAKAVEPNASDYLIELSGEGADIRRELFYALAAKSLPLLASRPMSATLEDVFAQLTKEESK